MENTNDRNRSGRFFEEYEISATITGVKKHLIYLPKVILDYLCCGYKINVEVFEKYCDDTAEQYLSLYGFNQMSPILHKELCHRVDFIKEAFLSRGQQSEEASES